MRAKEKMPIKITYRVCGLEEYDYPADSYDCVISNLYFIILQILTKFWKVYLTLKADGIFFFLTSNTLSLRRV